MTKRQLINQGRLMYDMQVASTGLILDRILPDVEVLEQHLGINWPKPTFRRRIPLLPINTDNAIVKSHSKRRFKCSRKMKK